MDLLQVMNLLNQQFPKMIIFSSLILYIVSLTALHKSLSFVGVSKLWRFTARSTRNNGIFLQSFILSIFQSICPVRVKLSKYSFLHLNILEILTVSLILTRSVFFIGLILKTSMLVTSIVHGIYFIHLLKHLFCLKYIPYQ